MAISIALLGILLSSMAWNALRTSERAQVEASLGARASELSLAFETGLAQQRMQLLELGLGWSRSDAVDEDAWQTDAKRFRELHEDCLALEWDAPAPESPPSVSGTPEGLSLAGSFRANPAVVEARRAGVETVVGPWTAGEKYLVAILVPVAAGEAPVRWLTALIDPAAALDRLAGPIQQEFALEVSAGPAVLYRRGSPAGGELSGAESSQAFRAGAVGTDWTVSVRPGRRSFATQAQLLQWFVLVGGIVLSVLIATTFWVGQLAMLRTRDLFGATVELEERERELKRQDESISAAREERRTLLESMKADREARIASKPPDPDVSELETFTYSVSHDLRSPMGAILNYAAVLTEDYGENLGEEGREYLRRISSSAQRAIGMMDALLAYARVGSQELRIADIDVAQMVREIHAELGQARPGRRPALSMGELPAVRGDPALLWTMFGNLLSNAFKYTESVEEPRLEVGGYAQGPDVVYYVKDNGIGFDMHHASKLFAVFERLPSGARHDGHGVGLAVVRRIARRHGGDVRAEGVPGKGATFFVSLPIEQKP